MSSEDTVTNCPPIYLPPSEDTMSSEDARRVMSLETLSSEDTLECPLKVRHVLKEVKTASQAKTKN